MLIDTHCHVYWRDFPIPADEVIAHAKSAGVMQMICVGNSVDTSKLAIEFSNNHPEAFATIGIHPHYAGKDSASQIVQLDSIIFRNGFAPGSNGAPAPDKTWAAEVPENIRTELMFSQKIVAIGETGLDYYKSTSSRSDQIALLEKHIELALKYNLPLVFHVRDAYDDFWPIIDNFISAGQRIRGVLHSFTDTMEHAEKGLGKGFYIGVNGISTFTKIDWQKEMFANLPLDKIVLETDAPYLTPSPLRGKINCNEPAYIAQIAQHLGEIRGISFIEIADVTTENARTLFNLK